MNENTILRTVPAANDLHKVPGFDPLKYLRKAVNEKGDPACASPPTKRQRKPPAISGQPRTRP